MPLAAPPAEPPIPQPGDLLGWVILYGPKRDHHWFVPAALGASVAPEKVTHNHLEHAIILRAVVG